MSYSQRVDQGYLSLARGLVTESSKLAAVEGATSDELNMVLDTNGMIRKRRKGLNSLAVIDPSSQLLGQLENAYFWDLHKIVLLVSVSEELDEGVPTGFFIARFTFIDKNQSPSVVEEYSVRIDAADFAVPQFTEIRDRVVVSMGSDPIVISRNEEGQFSVFRLKVYIRDFQLLDDDLSIAERPSTLSDSHKYNLYNAGWWQERTLDGGAKGDPVVKFNTDRTEYPSNSDVSYLGDVVNANGDLEFTPSSFDNINAGNSEAPRGHYVYLSRRINRASKLTAKDQDGTPSKTLEPALIDGELPGGGTPTDPSEPIGPSPTEPCAPGEICTIEP